MNQKIRIGIIGYGNLGKGVELALTQNEDMELIGVFSRRDPASLTLVSPSATAYPLADLGEFKEYIDVMILCGGSKDDLPVQGPEVAEFFTMGDSCDTHAQ